MSQPVHTFGRSISFRVDRRLGGRVSIRKVAKLRAVAQVAEAQGDTQTAELARSMLAGYQAGKPGSSLPSFL